MIKEYWIVKNNKTGRVICHCADINDAIMMVSFDPDYRSYSRERIILDQVITVQASFENQLKGEVVENYNTTPKLDFHKVRLPEGQGQPVIV